MLAAETNASSTEAVLLAADSPFAWKQIVEPVDPFLHAVAARLAEQVQAFDPAIRAFAQYALRSQGKQLRPVLVGLSGRCVGQLTDAHITVAVIIEIVHLATLVHDDVLDEAEIRRGQPTLAANWGNDISVLLGDCLFAHALKLAASFPTPEICRAVAAATNTVCAGEILQTQQRRNFKFSQAEYFKVLAMKTGELFALSCDLGALLGQAAPAQRTALRQFGLALGTAYQVYDDCVDLFASEATVGKSLGTDLAKGKLTLPVLLLLEGLPPAERIRVQETIEHWAPSYLPQLLKWLKQYKTLARSQEEIHSNLNAACQHLHPLPSTKGRAGLIGLTEFLAQQTDALGGAE
jgi:octaprenyl-diphosphate synthase